MAPRDHPGGPAGDSPRLGAVIVAGPPAPDARASLENLAFAAARVVVPRDEEAARAYRAAGAERVLEPCPGAGLRPDLLPRQALEAAGEGWLLIVDGEERVSLELRDEIRAAAAAAGEEVRALAVPITRYYFGRYLRHGGWPRREPRIFRSAAAGAAAEASAESADLESLLVHLGDRRIGDALHRMRRNLEAGCAPPAGPVGPRRLLLEPLGRFASLYLARRGFLDGIPGLVAAALAALERTAHLADAWHRSRPDDPRESR